MKIRQNFWIILAVLATILVIYQLKNKTGNINQILSLNSSAPKNSELNFVNQGVQGPIFDSIEPPPTPFPQRRSEEESSQEPADPIRTDIEARMKTSNEVMNKFTSLSQLKMDLPETFQFIENDLDSDDVYSITGFEQGSDSHINLIASRVIPKTDQEVFQFLSSNQSYLQGLPKSFENLNKSDLPGEILKEKGFAKGKLFERYDRDGKFFGMVYLEREDGKVAYVFTLYGASARWQDQDDFFEKIYQSIVLSK